MPNRAATPFDLDAYAVRDRPTVPAELSISPPRQQRSREAWARVLDVGVDLLERVGYEGFTIAALSADSGVNPRALYERASNKNALFFAVYEHKLERMSDERDRLFARTEDDRLSVDGIALRAVDSVLRLFDDNSAFLRTVIGLAPAHPAVYARGKYDSAVLGDRFVRAVCREGARIEDVVAARYAYRTVYATAVMRTMRGPDFLAPGPTIDEEALYLTGMVAQYILRP